MTLLPAKKGDWTLFYSIKGNDVEYFPGLRFCAKDGEISPPFVPSKDWEHSERGDSLAFFLEKDWRGFSFIFQYKWDLQRGCWEDPPAFFLENKWGKGACSYPPVFFREATGLSAPFLPEKDGGFLQRGDSPEAGRTLLPSFCRTFSRQSGRTIPGSCHVKLLP